MRISDQMILRDALRGLRGNLETLLRVQEEATTGRRIRRVSDEPLDASHIMRLDSDLRSMDRFRRTIAVANTRLSTEEAVLTMVGDLLKSAQQLAGDAAGAEDDSYAEAALREINTIREEVITLANTKLVNEFIFAGSRTDTAPFLDDGTYVGDSKVREVEVAEGIRLPTNHTGDQVFVEVLDALEDLVQEVESGTDESLNEALERLKETIQDLVRAQVEVGSRLRKIDDFDLYLVQRSTATTDQLDELQEVDPTEAILKLTQAQQALERAYAAVGRVLETNILKYLR
jgi:flagellar hook-associated protein 3 FlgL